MPLIRTGTPNLTCAAESCRTWLALVRTVRETSGARPQLASAATASSADWQRVTGLGRRAGRSETASRASPLTTVQSMQNTLHVNRHNTFRAVYWILFLISYIHWDTSLYPQELIRSR